MKKLGFCFMVGSLSIGIMMHPKGFSPLFDVAVIGLYALGLGLFVSEMIVDSIFKKREEGLI